VSVEWGTRLRKAAGQEGGENIGEPKRTIYIELIPVKGTEGTVSHLAATLGLSMGAAV
jgi:hypothetical protein